MKIAYIAHPIRGALRGNLEKIREIGRKINLTEPNTVPFAPYYFDCYSLDDRVLKERKRGIKNDVCLIKRGFIDEVRLYGDRITPGMMAEINLAHDLKIPVIPMTTETKKLYELHLPTHRF